MSETSFPVNDLLRRKLQTSLIAISLVSSVASTVFLLLFADRMGLGISLIVEDKMTSGFSVVFGHFTIFVALLIFIVGAVTASFMVFVMMSQRMRDIGLMKAAGCPNDLVFGYFMTELLIIAFLGCFLGVVLGTLADFALASFFSNAELGIAQGPPNIWGVLLIFVAFFALILIFGAKPILSATEVEPAKALSHTYVLGLTKEHGFKTITKFGFTTRIAVRNLSRRKSATMRILLCMSIIFILLTVVTAGGIIADQTSKSWIEKAVGRDIALIAHHDLCSQYRLLLSEFYEGKQDLPFNYTTEEYLTPETLPQQLSLVANVEKVDQRLVLEAHIREVRSYIFDPETQHRTPVGDDREGEALVIGVDPKVVVSSWFVDGEFLEENSSWEAVVGDSVAQKMFSAPLSQGIRFLNKTFDVKGICVDPINNGNVVYVPLQDLQNTTGISKPNLIVVKISDSANFTETLSQLSLEVSSIDPSFEVFDLDQFLDKDLRFLDYVWSTVRILPFFALATASVCLVGYVMLVLTEQQLEFGVLRAIGVNSGAVVKIVAGQTFIVLLSSYLVATALGIITTLLILVPEPLVTSYTTAEIAAWLLAAWTVIFGFSLYPALKFARKPILEMVNQS